MYCLKIIANSSKKPLLELTHFYFLFIVEEHNFKKYSHLSADQLGVNYDYQTIMHYGPKAFSKNGKQTIKAIGNDGIELGQMLTLSASDTIQINALYDCASKKLFSLISDVIINRITLTSGIIIINQSMHNEL